MYAYRAFFLWLGTFCKTVTASQFEEGKPQFNLDRFVVGSTCKPWDIKISFNSWVTRSGPRSWRSVCRQSFQFMAATSACWSERVFRFLPPNVTTSSGRKLIVSSSSGTTFFKATVGGCDVPPLNGVRVDFAFWLLAGAGVGDNRLLRTPTWMVP